MSSLEGTLGTKEDTKAIEKGETEKNSLKKRRKGLAHVCIHCETVELIHGVCRIHQHKAHSSLPLCCASERETHSEQWKDWVRGTLCFGCLVATKVPLRQEDKCFYPTHLTVANPSACSTASILSSFTLSMQCREMAFLTCFPQGYFSPKG